MTEPDARPGYARIRSTDTYADIERKMATAMAPARAAMEAAARAFGPKEDTMTEQTIAYQGERQLIRIGDWVSRVRRVRGRAQPRRDTQWHLVDSLVAGDVMTRCGRRMAITPAHRAGELQPASNRGELISASLRCAQCRRAWTRERQAGLAEGARP